MPSLKPEELIKLVEQYSTRFKHAVPMAVLQGPLSDEEIAQLIKDALASGNPVPDWQGAATSSIQPPRPNPDSGPDSEARGWKQHNRQPTKAKPAA